ncbi:hypothetical protein VKT23_015706 [Stygiomarasmius scandens]|uniref:Glycosyltransferase family 8 protein n=1 Tax=Marasmiellus scandens TaxID=2682957 RepID=A0ABR1IX15_9AGAR
MSQDQSVYRFTETQDWFSHNIEHWKNLFPLITTPHPRVLEIGSWEGRSAVFLLNELCKDGGEIVCIDHFDLFHTPAGRERFEKINYNLAQTGKSFRVLSQFSFPALMKLLEEEIAVSPPYASPQTHQPGFDWIYVDGSHEADDTFLDGELVWRLARKGAIVIFDDYNWDKEPEDSIHHPKRGIDAFLILHDGEYERLTDPSHYQVVLRKTTEMRIGFLVENQRIVDTDEAMGYGINIALAASSDYALGAAVTIRSTVEKTPGRITFYIVDCGLTDEDNDNLKLAVNIRDDVTVVFLSLPNDALAKELGPVWAKLDLHNVLPVERVLYLDADLLVRSNLKLLWQTDLRGKPLAAIPDVGHPMGHSDIDRKAYFNAGVMLMDLAKIRMNGQNLHETGRKMKDSSFRDQDALNAHFTEWTTLSLKWNAQGLGTYAKYPSADRDMLNLNDMADPCIVHFTGPVHPTLAEVLNPYVQPPTAKPWGYIGAPEHPFEEEWWSIVEKTSWKGIRDSESWKSNVEREARKAIESAAEEFRRRVGL